MFRKIKDGWNSFWGNRSPENEEADDSTDYHFEDDSGPSSPTPEESGSSSAPLSAPRKQADQGLTMFEVGIVTAAYAVWLLISTVLYSLSGTQPVNFGIIMYAMFMAHVALSCRTISGTDLGVLEFLGKPTRNVNSGFVFVPFLFFTLKTETKLRIQFQIPAEPELVDKTGNDVPEKGKVFPIRVTHATPATAEGGNDKQYEGDPLHVRMTTEWLVAIWMQITDYLTFMQTVGSLENARAQIRDVCEATLKEHCGRLTPAQIIPRMKEVREKLHTRISELVADWGLFIPEIAITEMDLSHEINSSLRNIPDAVLRKEITITNAEAKRKESLLEGEALATNRELFLDKEGAMIARNRKILLEAEAVGAKALAEVMKTDEGKIAAQIEALRSALNGANYSILPGDSLHPLLSGLQNALSETRRKETPSQADAA